MADSYLMQKFLLKCSVAFFGAAIMCSVTLWGQQKDTTLREVVVSDYARRSVSKESAPVQMMSKTGIEKLGIQELYEAVRTFSGVSVKDYGGIGGVKTVSLRSMGAQHTAVCYDGVTMSDAQSGQIDIGRFSLENIDQITLTIGQGDDIFQSALMFASAGALNIRTSAPTFTDKKINTDVQLKGGSFGMFNPSIRLAGKVGKDWALSVAGDWMRADGEYPYQLTNGTVVTTEKRQNTDVDIWRAELNLYGKVGSSGKLLIKGNYLTSERGLPGSVILYNTNASRERLWDKNGFVQGGYENAVHKNWTIETHLKYNYAWNRYVDVDDKYQGGKQEDQYTQHEYYGSARVKFTPSNAFTLTFAQDIFENTLTATTPNCPNPNRLTSMSALAGQYMSERLTVTASLLGVLNTESVEQGNAAPDRKHLSPSAGISYQIVQDKNIRIRGSVKDAYRIPTFNDLYYARVGNTSLKPERATQYNVGITFNDQLFPGIFDFVTISADGYYNSVKDKIVAIPTMFIWKMLNMGTVDIWGADINFSAGVTICKNVGINLSGNYSYQYAVDLTDKTAKNYKHQIPYTPQHSGNISVSCINKWVNLGYTMGIVGERYALPQNIAENRIDGYCEQNISLIRSFNFGKCVLKLQAEMLNLGNATYDVIQYYPMPGRQYRFTLTFRY